MGGNQGGINPDWVAACRALDEEPETIHSVIRAYCWRSRIHPAMLKSSSRNADIVKLRATIARACYNRGHSINAIGRALNRDRTTIEYYLGIAKKSWGDRGCVGTRSWRSPEKRS